MSKPDIAMQLLAKEIVDAIKAREAKLVARIEKLEQIVNVMGTLTAATSQTLSLQEADWAVLKRSCGAWPSNPFDYVMSQPLTMAPELMTDEERAAWDRRNREFEASR